MLIFKKILKTDNSYYSYKIDFFKRKFSTLSDAVKIEIIQLSKEKI